MYIYILVYVCIYLFMSWTAQANSVVTIGLLALVRQRKIQWPTKPNQRIWLFARGVSSVFALAFAVLATFFDCPAGDTMAISSTNVFASAVLGCFLISGQQLNPLSLPVVIYYTARRA